MHTIDLENVSEWVDLYNRQMSRSANFEPISVRRLDQLRALLEKHGTRFLIAYQSKQPSAIGSYIIDKTNRITRMLDFCVSPLFPKGGVDLVDQVLLESRTYQSRRVTSWIPLSLSTSLDVLGEYLFSPEKGLVQMRNSFDGHAPEIEIDLIEHPQSSEDESVYLPFVEPFKISVLMISIRGKWQRTCTCCNENRSSFIDVYQSNQQRRDAWIFHHKSHEPPTPEFLSSTLSLLHSKGIRTAYTEVEIGLRQRASYDICGFSEMSTDFLLTYSLEY